MYHCAKSKALHYFIHLPRLGISEWSTIFPKTNILFNAQNHLKSSPFSPLNNRTFATVTEKKLSIEKGKKVIKGKKETIIESSYPYSRSFSEEKYMTSRGFHVQKNDNLSSSLYSFNHFVKDVAGISFSKMKETSRWMKPCHVRRQSMYASRKRKFNSQVKQKVDEILSIHKGENDISF